MVLVEVAVHGDEVAGRHAQLRSVLVHGPHEDLHRGHAGEALVVCEVPARGGGQGVGRVVARGQQHPLDELLRRQGVGAVDVGDGGVRGHEALLVAGGDELVHGDVLFRRQDGQELRDAGGVELLARALHGHDAALVQVVDEGLAAGEGDALGEGGVFGERVLLLGRVRLLGVLLRGGRVLRLGVLRLVFGGLGVLRLVFGGLGLLRLVRGPVRILLGLHGDGGDGQRHGVRDLRLFQRRHRAAAEQRKGERQRQQPGAEMSFHRSCLTSFTGANAPGFFYYSTAVCAFP